MQKIKKKSVLVKNNFNELISRVDMNEEWIWELEDMTIETSQTEMQRKKE